MILLLVLPLIILSFVYVYIVKPLTYWKDRDVKCMKPTPIFGNYLHILLRKENLAELTQKIYSFASDERYVGLYQFTTPILLIKDPGLIEQICVKDFQTFPTMRDESRSIFMSDDNLRTMFGLVDECARQFVQHFSEKTRNTQMVDMKDIFTRYTNDAIATCGFGVECDSLRHKTNEFYMKAKDASDCSLMKLPGDKIFNHSTSSFFKKLTLDTIKSREKNGTARPDLINLLMESRKGRDVTLTDNDIAAQALIFLLASYDMSLTLMSFAAYELAINPYVQKKLINEVEKTMQQCNGKISHEALSGMTYLDMVISETLRKWPPTVITERVSIKPYRIATDEKSFLHLPKGSVVFVPSYALHRDPQLYRNPDHFDPERFNERNKLSVNPYAFVPFGAGPTNCIESRFALLGTKTIIFHVLSNFEIVPVEKSHIPMVLSKSHFGLTSKGGMWLGLKPRKSKVYY